MRREDTCIRSPRRDLLRTQKPGSAGVDESNSESENWWGPVNNVPKGLGLVGCEDPVVRLCQGQVSMSP